MDLTLMTVSGPISASGIRLTGPVLCLEWLCSDQSALADADDAAAHQQDSCPQRGDRVELANLFSMRRWPFASLHNLHLPREDVSRELCGAFKRRHGGGLVVVSTPPAYWSPHGAVERARALGELASESGLVVVAGTAPAAGRPASPADFETEVARLVTDLSVGYEAAEPRGEGAERVRPGFLGEVRLWDPARGQMPASEALCLGACVEAQRLTQAALVLSGAVSGEALAILEGRAGAPSTGPCLWHRCAFFDVPPGSPVPPAELASRGCFLGFCPPPAGADISWQARAAQRPWKTEEAFLQALAAAPPGRALVSSGLRFRTDLAAFGGPGLGLCADLLAAARPGDARLPSEDSLRAAALELFAYPWQPPAPPEQVVHTIYCHWCGTGKPEGEHFSKGEFDYCSPKCIGKHRARGFAVDAHDR